MIKNAAQSEYINVLYIQIFSRPIVHLFIYPFNNSLFVYSFIYYSYLFNTELEVSFVTANK